VTLPKCLLVGGRSNVGKSTVAGVLAARLGGVHVSTDALGRHPGRPWGSVPPHVAAHYESQTDETIFAALIAHQLGLQGAIEALVREHDGDPGKPTLVLEGSALMPGGTMGLISDRVRAVWLTASDDFIRRRIEVESGYAAADAAGRRRIERFIERNRRLDGLLQADARRMGLILVGVDGESVQVVADRCLSAMS